MKVVTCVGLFVVPEVLEDVLVSRSGDRPRRQPEPALLAWTDSIVEREGEGSVCAQVCVFVLCAVCLVEVGVNIVENRVFCVSDVSVRGV